MQLTEARLCLDCEELHAEARCPVCASEAFAFLTRWVPPNERKPRVRRPPPSPSRKSQWITAGGAAGLALVATARWLLRPPATSASERQEHVDGKVGDEPEQDGGQDERSQARAER